MFIFFENRLERHSEGLSKVEHRLNRLVDIDVSFNRPSNNHQGRRLHQGRAPSPEGRRPPVTSTQQDKVPDLAEDFPSLSNNHGISGLVKTGTGNDNMANRLAKSSGRNWSSGRPNSVGSLHEQDFPSLPGAAPSGSTPTIPREYRPDSSKAKAKNNPPQSKVSYQMNVL